MGEVMALHDPLNYRRVLLRIKKLWDEGSVVVLPHAQTQMQARGLDLLDVQHVIRYGRITDHSRPGELWRYKVAGMAVDGQLFIVTVIGGRGRTR